MLALKIRVSVITARLQQVRVARGLPVEIREHKIIGTVGHASRHT
jgi:hypothetical protein